MSIYDRGYPAICNRCGFWWDEANQTLRRSSTAAKYPCNRCLNPTLAAQLGDLP